MAGRPKGHAVRVQEPQPERGTPSGRLFIGRGLYEAIGAPRRVALLTDGASVLIQEGDEYGVVVPKSGQPRLSLGDYARELLGLDAGTYPAIADRRRIVIRRGEATAVPTPKIAQPPAVPAVIPTEPPKSRIRVRANRTLMEGTVVAHREGERSNHQPYVDVVVNIGGSDTLHVVTGWAGIRQQLQKGDVLEIEIRRKAHRDPPR